VRELYRYLAYLVIAALVLLPSVLYAVADKHEVISLELFDRIAHNTAGTVTI